MPRRALTDEQRNILQAERSHKRMQATETFETYQREEAHHESRIGTEQALAQVRARNSGRTFRARTSDLAKEEAARKTVSTVSDNSGLIMTTIFVWAGLIIAYILVTKSRQFAGYTGSLGNFLHKVSSTTPLFQTVPKGS